MCVTRSATFCAATPLQLGVARALEAATAARAESPPRDYFAGAKAASEGNARLLSEALAAMDVPPPAKTGEGNENENGAGGGDGNGRVAPLPVQGGYFLVADVAATGHTDWSFCRWLVAAKGVSCVPVSLFTDLPADGSEAAAGTLVRFALCKSRALVERAARALGGGGAV